MAIIGGEPTCPVAHSLDVLGDRWSLLIMRNALRGSTRFSEFRDALGIPRDILTARLTTLVEGGVLERRGYQSEGARRRDEYVVTDAGRELSVILAALGEWGVRHAGGATTLRFTEAVTDEIVGARLVTSDGRVVDAQHVALTSL